MTASDLKPRTVGELLDAAFTAYRRSFGRLALVAVLVSVPAVVVAALYADDAAAALRDSTALLQKAARGNQDDPGKTLGDALSAYGLILPTTLLAMALQAFSRAGVSVAMAPVAAAAVRRGEMPGLGAILRAAAPRLPAAFVLQSLFDVSWSPMSCCCPPVFFVVGVALAPAAAVLVLERGPLETALRGAVPWIVAAPLAPFAACVDAFARGVNLSWNLAVVGRGLAVFGILLTFLWIFGASVTMPVAALDKDSGRWFWIQHVAEMVFLPVVGLGRALWYFDLRARREGLDLAETA